MLVSSRTFGYEYFELGHGTLYKRGYTWDIFIDYWRRAIDYLIRLCRPARVLDIGCAKGYLVYEFRRRGVETFGVDISEYALLQSPSSMKPFLCQADICETSLPFHSGVFDLITSLETIEHLNDPEKMIHEISRLLRTDGVIFISTPSPGTDVAKADVTHVNVRSFKTWKRCFKKAHIRIKTLEPWVWEGERGRLGNISEPLRSIIRRAVYPFLNVLIPRRRHLYLLGRKD
ncbi:MAG: class I SAM-dependent methyltransferase [Candidatus Omnitrophica bacterium]|nr:class I SAM-dependent methyltransferase [Candidatus Omnitrophota bacterium]